MRETPNIDVLRSMAVISVVVEHILLALGIQRLGPYEVQFIGVLGVMVFFVLTSLVLMWSLERRPHTLDFYIRRAFRIYPLAMTAVLCAWLLHVPVSGTPADPFGFAQPHLKDLLVSLALLQDIIPARPVLSVLWTLPYEVHMYLLLPLLYFFVRKNRVLWPLLLMWLLVVMETWHVGKQTHNFAVAIAYFLPGVMAYVGFAKWKPRLPGWLLPLFVLALGLFTLRGMNFHRAWYFCLALGLAIPAFEEVNARWLIASSRVLARYSYGVYLTHPFAIVIGLYLLAGYSLAVRVLGLMAPLLILPVLAYHLIEHPMILLGSRLAARTEAAYEQAAMQ
jgi:peptidoglycan/LPS O-acetylase OafA/YrhL